MSRKMVISETNKDTVMVMIRFVALIVLGILVQIGASYLLNGIMLSTSDLSEINKEYSAVVESLTQIDIKVLVHTMIVAPVVEEAVFRFAFIGLLYKLWNDYSKDRPTITVKFWVLNVISSLMFAIYHPNGVQRVYAFILGMMLGYVYFYLGKYIASLVVHMVINTSGVYLTPLLPDTMSYNQMIIIGSVVMLICACIPVVLRKITTSDK